MTAAARCDPFFAGCRNRDRNAEARTAAATYPTCAKQPDAAKPDGMAQPTRMKNDLKSFVLCPYNGSGSPAAPRARSARGERRRATRQVRDEPSRDDAQDATPVHHGLPGKSARGAVRCSRVLYGPSRAPPQRKMPTGARPVERPEAARASHHTTATREAGPCAPRSSLKPLRAAAR